MRIWEEPRERENAKPIWRGSVESVADRRQVHFDDPAALTAYLLDGAGSANRVEER